MMNDKETLILLPGLLCDATVWKHQIEHLQEICHVLVPDFTSCQTLSETLDVILEKAPKQFMLAGHSMGGWIALEVMRTQAMRVTKLCLLDTNAEIDSVEIKQQRLDMIEQVKRGNIEQVIDSLVQRFVYQEAAKLDVKKMFLNNQKAFILQEDMMLKRESCMGILSTLSIPPLLIVGKNDSKFYSKMLQMKQALRAGKLAIIEDSGHMTPMETPQAVTAFMRFWIEYL